MLIITKILSWTKPPQILHLGNDFIIVGDQYN